MNIKRGFHRIGVVVAAPLLLAGAILAGAEAYQTRTPPHQVGALDGGSLKLPPGFILENRPNNSYAQAPPAPPDYFFAALASSAGIFSYLFFRALGWIIVGFRRDDL